MQELLERIARDIEALKQQRTIPIERDLWDSKCCAAYLKCTPRTVCETYAPLPDFPRAHRLPTGKGTVGRPLWPASEVIDWAKKYRERS